MNARIRYLLLAAALLGGCSTVRTPERDAPHDGAWHPVLLPGKRATSYRSDVKEGRASVMAVADRSASLWRRSLRVPPSQLGSLEFSWWIHSQIEGATVQQPETDDAPVRVVLAFEGDTSRLSARNQAMFELARLATGEPPPYATLMYVWDTEAELESVVVSRRSDRIRKIVVERGDTNLRTWRGYKRDIVADFRRAFGEDPGPLIGLAFMTDGDNTESLVQAWYGEVRLR